MTHDYRSIGPTGPVCRHVGNPATCTACAAMREPCVNCGEPVAVYDQHTQRDHTEWTCKPATASKGDLVTGDPS